MTIASFRLILPPVTRNLMTSVQSSKATMIIYYSGNIRTLLLRTTAEKQSTVIDCFIRSTRRSAIQRYFPYKVSECSLDRPTTESKTHQQRRTRDSQTLQIINMHFSANSRQKSTSGFNLNGIK